LLSLIVLVIGVLWFADHERGVEREKIAAQNYQQLVVAKAKADAETARLQGVADAADKVAKSAQADFDKYRTNHPVGHVWVCQQTPSGQHGASGISEAHGGNAGTGTGPETSPAVPAGSTVAATDVGPELDTIMQGFAELAIQLSRWQHQPVAE
jgi:Tfp pilus assembly major pilin PilA